MTANESQFASMDNMYRYQRYFYDLTRKYYLLGRDRLIRDMKIGDGDNVVELGCGTARNLVILARKHPAANFFGLDASAEMLKTAESKVESNSLNNVSLKTALANEFSYDETFGLDDKFDACFFSYAVSIIPPWRESIERALANLKPGKSLYIVDFYDQQALPSWFRRILQSWLRQFHVKYPTELIPFLEDIQKSGAGTLTVKPLYRRYSLLAEFRKAL